MRGVRECGGGVGWGYTMTVTGLLLIGAGWPGGGVVVERGGVYGTNDSRGGVGVGGS